MNIQVNNLDLAFDQCYGIHTLASNSGQTLINDLQNNINALKLHWKGSDATLHINNLIKVHKALVALITDAKLVTSDAADKIIAIQEVRKSNGGVGNVGSPLSKSAPSSVVLPEVSDTAETYVVPEAKNDHMDLSNICNKYNSFIQEFTAKKDELFGNWLAGANIERAKTNFNEFLTNSTTYNGYLNSAKDNLGIAVSNMSQL